MSRQRRTIPLSICMNRACFGQLPGPTCYSCIRSKTTNCAYTRYCESFICESVGYTAFIFGLRLILALINSQYTSHALMSPRRAYKSRLPYLRSSPSTQDPPASNLTSITRSPKDSPTLASIQLLVPTLTSLKLLHHALAHPRPHPPRRGRPRRSRRRPCRRAGRSSRHDRPRRPSLPRRPSARGRMLRLRAVRVGRRGTEPVLFDRVCISATSLPGAVGENVKVGRACKEHHSVAGLMGKRWRALFDQDCEHKITCPMFLPPTPLTLHS